MSGYTIVWDSTAISFVQLISINSALACLGYGWFFILAISAVRVLIRRGLYSPGQRYLLATVLISLMSSTVSCVATLVYNLGNLTLGPGPYNDNKDAMELCEKLGIVIPIFNRVIYILSDMLVVWRAWVLADRLPLRMMLAFGMLIMIGSAMAEAVIFIQARPFLLYSKTLDLLLYVPLVLNNLMATSVVLYKTWIYRTQIKADLQQGSRKSQVERVLFLLIESSFLYCGWWMLIMILKYAQSIPLTVYYVFDFFNPSVTAIYPMLIILIVEYQKSKAEQPSMKSIHSLHFNVPPNQSHDENPPHHAVSIIQSIVDIQLARRTRDLEGKISGRIQSGRVHNEGEAREKPEGGILDENSSGSISETAPQF